MPRKPGALAMRRWVRKMHAKLEANNKRKPRRQRGAA